MTWQFKSVPWMVYPRNPLDTVVAQVRFQPILRIASGNGIPEFQELIRSRFPGFSEREAQSVSVGPETKVSTKSEKLFIFIREEGACKVQLSPDNVLIECKQHLSRDDLHEDLNAVVNALIEIFAPIDTIRFGVRYINVINAEQIEADLGKNVTLNSLVDKEYLSIPASVADLSQTIYLNQISSPMEFGAMTLRFGMPPPKTGASKIFNFDIDRFVDGVVNLEEVGELYSSFAGDIFSLFCTLPGEDLLEWMSQSTDD